jgi:hypothetical protein
MGIVEDLLSDKGGEFVGALVDKADFSAEQAQGFAPAALSALTGALGGGGLDIGSLLGGADLGALLSKIDLGSLASQTGVDSGKAESGLQVLVPLVLSALQGKAGGADGIASLLGGSDALGAAGKLAGKLFGG